ncbi:hypothetical protein M440DRAFT_1049388 [Trichoderma longibrachiatum ATCC 18648]|uniref:Uncharacterized protein n=1 Tax=Trichoderma longibrachiatum ATCC 18648 TaxID=983965 RepID=A0A2T4BVE9_TRILO|nr:hypothetical protein M440DRAFT_1059527 [Trichoderma longibrachiatum ATCC 18648]PTB74499.1 hypothetical protein M440DRAFT_1049388 [Trichoderma longibrachiatum ATCC 18648]
MILLACSSSYIIFAPLFFSIHSISMRLGSTVRRVGPVALFLSRKSYLFGMGWTWGHENHLVWIEAERKPHLGHAHIQFILTIYIVRGHFGRHFT